jgi:hypothetical protein
MTVKLAATATAAIVTLLRADTTLRSLLVGSTTDRWSIYDEVPEGAAYPYVQIGDGAAEAPDDTFDKQGSSVVIGLVVWSQYAGAKEARAIVDRIRELLDRATLNVSPYTLEWCRVELADVTRDPDGRTRHGLLRVRVQAREA